MCARCKNRTYQYEPVLKIIKDEINKFRSDVLQSIVSVENNADSRDIEYKRKHIEAQIRKATQALSNIDVLFEESEISLQQYRERKAKRNEQIEVLNQELEIIEQETPDDRLADLSAVLEQVDYVLQKWEMLDGEGLNNEEINRSLHYIVERIDWTYGKEDAEPTLKITYK